MAKNEIPKTEDPEVYITDEAEGLNGKLSSGSARNLDRLEQDEPYSLLNSDTEVNNDGTVANPEVFNALMDGEEMADDGTSLVTKDEQQEGITGDDSNDDDIEIVMGTEADVTAEDLVLLGDKDKDMDGGDDEDNFGIGLDATDEDGDPLNESSGSLAGTGDDLDIPDADMDDPASEAMGQGDEENNYYSLGSDSNDNVTEGTP